jgi:uncharacterized membrane protein YfcA
MIEKIKRHSHVLHKTGMFLSVLCLIHCLSMPFVVTLLPYLAKDFISHTTEIILMGGSALIASYLLTKDYRVHGRALPILLLIGAVLLQLSGFFLADAAYETPLVVTGSLLMAWAFLSNWRLHQKSCDSHVH